jgi:hypothetical protein
MKIFLFIGLWLLAVMLAKAQPYQRCLDDSIVRWSILDYHVIDAGAVSTEIYAYGDILINSFLYKKLYIDGYSSFDVEETNTNWKNYTPNLSRQWKNFYIRESEDASKLYILDAENNKEYLIADLSLQKGDQFQIPWRHHYNDIFAVVDSVYNKNNLKHVKLHFSLQFDPDTLTFIEGTGPDRWFIMPWESGWMAYLNCFQNQTLFYKNELPTWFGDCLCGDSQGVDIKTTIYQNYHFRIKDGSLDIHFSFPGNRQISIYDISGRLYTKQTFSSETNTIIPLASFPKGVYLLKIEERNEKQTKVHKFIL